LAIALVAAGLAPRGAQAQVVYAWGQNTNGQLGNGTTTTGSSVPMPVIGLSNGATVIAAGYQHSVAVVNGQVYAWGRNDSGQLGNGSSASNSNVPVPVGGLPSGVTALSAGDAYTLAVANGQAYAWGNAGSGDLGNGFLIGTFRTPAPVNGMSSGVTAVAASFQHSHAIMNGQAYSWGRNVNGDRGDGTSGGFPNGLVVPVSGLSSGVTAIAGGFAHVLAVANGQAYAWGYNAEGELGNGTTTNSSVPAPVNGLSSGVTAVAGGAEHSLALVNGRVYAWGYNGDGELGNGTTTNSTVPMAVSGLDGLIITRIAAGPDSNYALTSTNRLFAWGDDTFGELGIGSTGDFFTTPQEVFAPNGYSWTSISGNPIGFDVLATLTPVPEPSSLVLCGAAVIGWVGHQTRVRWRRAAGPTACLFSPPACHACMGRPY
jgi:alpha-tubulin suppressor-like RCC1 family protein